MEFYNRVGKAEGLAKLLASSTEKGLSPDPGATGPDSVAEHRRVFGANKHAEVPPKNVRQPWNTKRAQLPEREVAERLPWMLKTLTRALVFRSFSSSYGKWCKTQSSYC